MGDYTEQGHDIEEAIALYDTMDKYDCDMDVAEIMLQDDMEDRIR